MKFEHFNRKNTAVALYACMVVAFGVLLVFAFVNLGALGKALGRLIDVLYPVIYGFIIAYLINPIYKFIYNRAFYAVGKKKGKTRLRGALSLLVTYVFVFCVVFLFFLIVVPQLVESYTKLTDQILRYINDASLWVNKLLASSELTSELFSRFSGLTISEVTKTVQEVITKSYGAVTAVTPYLISFVSSFVTVAKNWIIGLIISVYLLASKETLCAQIEKTAVALLRKERARKLEEFAYYVNHTFGRFLLGKIFDSFIIGVLTFIVMSICRIPYTPLISVIIGVTNIIPFFGPFIGAIPSVLIVLIDQPVMAVWTLLIILVIQQIDGNIIGPKIIGDTTGISSLWIVISIIVFGGLFGIIGMIIAVPLFSIIYRLLKSAVEKRLQAQGMSTDTADYLGKGFTEPEPQKKKK